MELRELFLLIMALGFFIGLAIAAGGTDEKIHSHPNLPSSSKNPSKPPFFGNIPSIKERFDKLLLSGRDIQKTDVRLSLTDEEDNISEDGAPLIRSKSYSSLKKIVDMPIIAYPFIYCGDDPGRFRPTADNWGTRTMTKIKDGFINFSRHASEIISHFSRSPEKEAKKKEEEPNEFKIHAEKIRRKYFPKRKGLMEQMKHFVKIEKEKMNKLCNKDAIMKLAKNLEGNEKEDDDDEEEGKREEEHLGGSTESHDEYGESGEGYFENSKLPENEEKELPIFGSLPGTSSFLSGDGNRSLKNRSFKQSGSFKKGNKSQEIENEEEELKKKNNKGKEQQSPHGLKRAIRLALRKYFCDVYNNNMDDWIPHKQQKWNGKKMELVPDKEEKHEWVFLREEWNVSSEFAFDFRFWVIFPEKFKALLKHFKMASPKTMMLSLTEKALDGLDNPAASDSIFYKSRDKHFMLKSVQLVKKQFQKSTKFWEKLLNVFSTVFNIDMEPLIEKDFFFKDLGKRKLKDENIEHFHNGLEAYMEYMKKMPKTMLPKLYCLFAIQTSKSPGEEEFEFLFTIQNFLVPTGSDIRFKFDLKGSTYNREKKENDENLKDPEMTWTERNYFRIPKNDANKNLPPHGLFKNGIILADELWAHIFLQIEADTLFLKRLGILDYSLLLGVNNGKMKSKFGLEGYDPMHPTKHPFENNVKISFGIIDILQTFVTRKKGESFWKSWLPPEDLKTLSFPYTKHGHQIYPLFTIVPPELYRRRFRAYVTQVVFHPWNKKNAREKVEELKGEYGIKEIDWKEADQFEDIIRIELPTHSAGKTELPLSSLKSEELSRAVPIYPLKSILGDSINLENEEREGSTSISALRGGEEIEMKEIGGMEKLWFGGNIEEEDGPNWE